MGQDDNSDYGERSGDAIAVDTEDTKHSTGCNEAGSRYDSDNRADEARHEHSRLANGDDAADHGGATRDDNQHRDTGAGRRRCQHDGHDSHDDHDGHDKHAAHNGHDEHVDHDGHDHDATSSKSGGYISRPSDDFHGSKYVSNLDTGFPVATAATKIDLTRGNTLIRR